MCKHQILLKFKSQVLDFNLMKTTKKIYSKQITLTMKCQA